MHWKQKVSPSSHHPCDPQPLLKSKQVEVGTVANESQGKKKKKKKPRMVEVGSQARQDIFFYPSLNFILILFLLVPAWRPRVAAPLSALYQRRKR